MTLRLPRINPGLLAKGFSQSFAKRAIEGRLYPILEGVGEERIRWLIENDQMLYPRFPKSLYEEAKGYGWMLKAFSQDELINMFPEWMVKVCQSYGEKGNQWLNHEVTGIRKVLGDSR